MNRSLSGQPFNNYRFSSYLSETLYGSDSLAHVCFRLLEECILLVCETHVDDLVNTVSTDKSRNVKRYAADPVFAGNVVTSSAKAGDVILVESFDALMYGGDLTTFSAGYSRVDRSALTSPAIPSGEDPDKTATITDFFKN